MMPILLISFDKILSRSRKDSRRLKPGRLSLPLMDSDNKTSRREVKIYIIIPWIRGSFICSEWQELHTINQKDDIILSAYFATRKNFIFCCEILNSGDNVF